MLTNSYRATLLWAFFVSVDSEDLNGELDDVGQPSKNGLISNEFQQALSTHFDSTSHRDNNKDIGKSHAYIPGVHKPWPAGRMLLLLLRKNMFKVT